MDDFVITTRTAGEISSSGETFLLSSMPIWVQPVAVALSVVQGGAA